MFSSFLDEGRQGEQGRQVTGHHSQLPGSDSTVKAHLAGSNIINTILILENISSHLKKLDIGTKDDSMTDSVNHKGVCRKALATLPVNDRLLSKCGCLVYVLVHFGFVLKALLHLGQ